MSHHLSEANQAGIKDLAESKFANNGEVEIDESPEIGVCENSNGAWVKAWVWVDFKGTEFDLNLNRKDRLTPDKKQMHLL